MDWIVSILIGTTLYAISQVFIRRCFDKDGEFMSATICFGLAQGLTALFFLVLLTLNEYNFKMDRRKLMNGLIVGLLFFIGNIFWVYSISTKASLGNIRTVMAGYEVLLLLLIGYMLFNENINLKQLSGVVLVLIGIYLTGTS